METTLPPCGAFNKISNREKRATNFSYTLTKLNIKLIDV